MVIQLYQKILQEMFEVHKSLFSKFKDIHDRYKEAPEKHQAEFNKIGEQVLGIIRKYENKLCGTTERGGYSKYSTHLSEKFWSGIRAVYPKIDFVGVQ